MRIVGLFAALIFTLSATGCFKHAIKFGDGGDISGMPDYDQAQFFFVEGVIGQANVDVSKICKDTTDATVVVEQPFHWGLVENCLCGELVNPVQVKVFCSKKKGKAEAMRSVPPNAERSAYAELMAKSRVPF